MSPEFQVPDVCLNIGEPGSPWHPDIEKKISGVFLVVVIYQSQPVIKEINIQPNVVLLVVFPSNSLICQIIHPSPGSYTVTKRIVCRGNRGDMGVITNIKVTYDPKTCP